MSNLLLQQLLLLQLLLALLVPLHLCAIHITTSGTPNCRVQKLVQVSSIACTGSEISEVPTVDTNLQAKIFYMDSCSISAIGPDSFANLSDSLIYLRINSTVPIANLSSHAFRNLSILAELVVVASALQPTPAQLDQLLSTLTSLNSLHLENVKLGYLPTEFAAGTKLTKVRLINADIVSIANDAFARLPTLSVLEMCKNPSSSYMSSLLRQIGTVENLTMTYCDLTQVTTEASFSRLCSINLSNNQLIYLDLRGFGGAEKTLKELNVNSNKLGTDGLPGLELMAALQRMYVADNPMILMPNNIGQLQSLEVLDARSTSITSIRVGDFNERSNLLSLKLDYAPLNFIEVIAFKKLGRLTELSLMLPASWVLFRSVTDRQPSSWSEMLTNLVALRNLTLRGYGPGVHSSIDDTVWPGLTGSQELRRLLLDYNNIASVPDFHFAWTPLDLLSLRGNEIKALNPASLYGLSPGAQVQLQDNRLTSLDNCSLAGLSSLSKVELGGNPWRCDCALVWLLDRLRNEAGSAALARLTCDQPSSLRGRSWSDLTAADFCPDGAPAPAACEMREPPTTAAPTPTAFPYPLNIKLTMEPGAELMVRMTVNVSSLASQFARYIVRYGTESDYQLKSDVKDALISVNSLTFHLHSVTPHRFCVILQRSANEPGAGDVEGPTNCRTFTPTSPDSQQLSTAQISAAVIVPIVGLVLIIVLIYCLIKRSRRQEEKSVMAATGDDYNSYTYVETEDPSRAGQFQSARKPESRRFTKRNGSNTMNGSQPSLIATPPTNLQQQLQRLQQQNQIQQMELQRMQRIHSMSQSVLRQSNSDPFSTSLPSDPRAAMRSARSTDALMSMMPPVGGGPPIGGVGYGNRAHSQDFGLADHPMLQRSRSGFAQYPAGAAADEDVPPPLPMRNPSLTSTRQESVYEEMDT